MKVLLITLISLLAFSANAFNYNVVRASAAYSVQASDGVVLMTGHGFAASLPACGSSNDGETHIFKNINTSGTTTVEVVPNGSDTVGLSGGWFIGVQQSETFSCDGQNHNWNEIAYD